MGAPLLERDRQSAAPAHDGGITELKRLAADLYGETSLETAIGALRRASDIIGTRMPSFVDNVVRDLPILDRSGNRLVETGLGWPSEVPDWWYGGSLIRYHPDFDHCRETTMPFFCTLLESDEADLSPQQVRLRKRFLDYDVASSIMVPVHQPNGVTGSVCWVATQTIDRDVLTEGWADLLVISHCFFNALEAYRADRSGETRDVKLTSRQTECVYWIANGKTMAETSIILGISAHTVREHL